MSFTPKPGGIGTPIVHRLSKEDMERLGVVRVPSPLSREEARDVLHASARSKAGANHRTEICRSDGKLRIRENPEPNRLR